MLLPHDHYLQPELTRKAIEHLEELHESLNWNRIALLVARLNSGKCRLWPLASEFHTSIHFIKAIYQLSFQTRDELKPEVAAFIVGQLRIVSKKPMATFLSSNVDSSTLLMRKPKPERKPSQFPAFRKAV